MSDSFVINITPDPSVNISVANNDPSVSVNATDANSAVSLAVSSGPNVSVAGYGVLANHAPTHHSGQKDELNHNLLGGLQGGSSSERYHLTKEQYDSLGGDGSFDFVSLTGNQTVSGVKTFVDRPLVNGTGVLLSGEFANTGYLTGYSTINYTNQISGNLQTEINKLSVNSIAYAIALG